jgi:hypothetical protein
MVRDTRPVVPHFHIAYDSHVHIVVAALTWTDRGGGKRRTVVATKSHQNVINESNGDASDQEAKDDGECQCIKGPSSDFCHLRPPNYCGRHGTRSSCRTRRKAITASLRSPPPLEFDAIGVKLQTPLGGSFEGRVTFFRLLVTSFQLVGIVFPLASEFLWLKTCELPLKLCELLLNLSELPYQCIEVFLFHGAPTPECANRTLS